MAHFVDLRQAWTLAENAIAINSNVETIPHDALLQSAAILDKHGISHIIEDWFFDSLQKDLCQNVAPSFWDQFKDPIDELKVVEHLSMTFDALYTRLSSYEVPMTNVASMLVLSGGGAYVEAKKRTLIERAQLLFKALIFSNTNKNFQTALHQFYAKAFKAFDHTKDRDRDLNESNESSGSDYDSVYCSGCDKEKEECRCSLIKEAFDNLNKQLRLLGLLERLSGEAVSSLIHNRIHQHVTDICKGNFEATFIQSLEGWLQQKVVVWLENLYGDFNGEYEGDSSVIAAHRDRLFHFMYESYAHTRISQLFNIIIEFPDSEPALVDLKTCLLKTDLRGELVKSLKNALESRLLHPGVNTADILTAYISAIRGLKVLDPTGVLLDLVCEPVKKYLRNREDTVRCIVSSLTEDSNMELSDELIKGQPLVLDESYQSDEENENWEAWLPDPVDADPAKLSHSRRSSDIISMLVNIYGSRELFVNEYRTLLADRILTHFNYDTEKEIRYLELLKLRFGESQLHYCEVMLKDVADSKRINMHITEQKEKLEAQDMSVESKEKKDEVIPVSSMILSAQFWPTFREEKVKIPDDMQAALDKHTKAYEALKGNRTLNWRPHLGLVDIEIEIKDRKLNLNVSPVHAIIISNFQERARWTVDELSAEMQMPSVALRRKMAFWQSQGLLKEESTDTFVLVEDHKGKPPQDIGILDEVEAESAMASANDQKEEELQVLWSYINGMLTNLESLPLERIHAMLKMFAMQGPPGGDVSIGELKAFLDKKVKDQKLVHSQGVYRLPKAT